MTHAFLSLVLKSKEKTIVNLDSMIALEARPGVRALLITDFQDVSDKTDDLTFVSLSSPRIARESLPSCDSQSS